MSDPGIKGLTPASSFRKGRERAPRISAPCVPGRHHERYWTEEELAIVREWYPQGGLAAVAAHLPRRRGRASIYQAAHKLGLSRLGPPERGGKAAAPENLDELLTGRWPELSGKGALTRFADEIGVGRWVLSKRARDLGLTTAHKKEPPWTAAEDALMAKAPLHSPDLAARLFREHGFRRTPTAIMVRAKRLGLSRRATRPTLSGTGVAKILGLDNKTVTRWCVAGELKAQRREDLRSPQQGGSAWDVEPMTLREFILANLARIDIRKVDKVAFVELIARCPKCSPLPSGEGPGVRGSDGSGGAP